MKLLIKLKKADEHANKIYSTCQKSFLGKIALKLISKIILACLIAAAVYLATNAYHTATAVSDDTRKINQVYISMSEEYADSLFGIPYISFVDENNLENNFYILNRLILRTVVDQNNIVAFFITSTNIKAKIPVASISDETKVIGKTVYSDIDFPMIKQVINNYDLLSVYAETDNDAVGFYQKNNFSITEFSEIYDGEMVIRYKCELTQFQFIE